MSVIDGSPRSATALIVGVGTRALAIRGETFRRFVEERSHVSGKIIGVVIGALIMGVMNMGMSILGIGIDYQQMIKGLVLLAAVIFDVYNKNK